MYKKLYLKARVKYFCIVLENYCNNVQQYLKRAFQGVTLSIFSGGRKNFFIGHLVFLPDGQGCLPLKKANALEVLPEPQRANFWH